MDGGRDVNIKQVFKLVNNIFGIIYFVFKSCGCN